MIVVNYLSASLRILLLILLSAVSSDCGKEWLRSKDKRESVCIQTAIQFHNVTMNFEHHLELTFKIDRYEDIVNKEGKALREEMDEIEAQFSVLIATMEGAGGIPPKTENSTTVFDQFSLDMEKKYEAMLRNMKDYVDMACGMWLLRALSSVKEDKKRLMDETDEYARLRTKFLDLNPILIGVGIHLQKPIEGTKKLTTFDISKLQDLLKVYQELDVIEDKMKPIMEEYYSLDEMEDDDEEFVFVQTALKRVTHLENIQIPKIVQENDNMLRHYEIIVNASVQRALGALPALTQMYDEMRERIIKSAKEFGAQDERIRGLSRRYNELLAKANEEALKIAMEDLRKRRAMREADEHDEL